MRRWALVASLAAIAGCSSVPEARYWSPARGAAAPQEAEPAAGQGLTVGVQSLAVDPPYDDPRLVWRADESASEIGFYNYHRWAAPLGGLAAVALSEDLNGLPGLASIEPASATSRYDATLSGRIRAVELLDSPQGLRARVRLDLELAAAGGETLWSESLARTSETSNGDRGAELLLATFDSVLADARAGLGAALAAR